MPRRSEAVAVISARRINQSFSLGAHCLLHRICRSFQRSGCSHFNQGCFGAGAKDGALPPPRITPFDAKADAMTGFVKFLHLAALTAASAIVLATTTEAQTPRNCAPRDHVVLRLADGYGETRQSMGLGGDNAVVEVFASDQTGSWTITVTGVNGITCLVASGQGFETLAEELPAKGEDA